MKKNVIKLTGEQRKELQKFSKTGVNSAKLIKRAEIILQLETSESGKAVTFEEISRRLDVSVTTITKVKKDFLAAEDVKAFLQRKKRDTPPVEPKITGEVEARIIALACSAVPAGCARWTVRLIADKSVELQIVDSLSFKSVQRLLKKHNLSLT
ncbi:MAG: helix-turn-helix domain-containing protein [Oscillospiraceae bacterium]|nr:helix-turn-helix domain-containing protein [Oscillospiraceae bacterium]